MHPLPFDSPLLLVLLSLFLSFQYFSNYVSALKQVPQGGADGKIEAYLYKEDA